MKMDTHCLLVSWDEGWGGMMELEMGGICYIWGLRFVVDGYSVSYDYADSRHLMSPVGKVGDDAEPSLSVDMTSCTVETDE